MHNSVRVAYIHKAERLGERRLIVNHCSRNRQGHNRMGQCPQMQQLDLYQKTSDD